MELRIIAAAQDRRQIDLFRRNETGIWELHEPDERGRLVLASIDGSLLVDDVYADVDLPEHPRLR